MGDDMVRALCAAAWQDTARLAQAEVERLRAKLARVEVAWQTHRDDENGTMPWRLVRDMDAALADPKADT
jgi:hypothetical protein